MDLNLNTMSDWKKSKRALSKIVSVGETVGLSDETIKKTGVKVGEFLASKVDPENREERLLKELFDVGSDKERQALTSMIIKMVDQEH